MGRPTLPESKKKKYQRVAMYKHTHQRLVKKAKTANKKIVDYLEDKI